VLISISSHSLKSHFRAWAHAYVLAGLAAGGSSGSNSEKSTWEQSVVIESLNRVRRVLDEDGGIEKALKNEGWNVDVSMMCPNESHRDAGQAEEIRLEDKVD
jgi:hypothetical protein